MQVTHRYSKYLNFLVMAGDLLGLNISLLSTFIVFHESISEFDESHRIIFLLSNLAWISISLISKVYQISRISKYSQIIQDILRTLIIHLLIISTALYFFDYHFTLRSHFLYFYFFCLVLIIGWRGVYLYTIRLYRKYGYNYRNVAIIGYGELAEDIRKFVRLHPEYGFRFLGFFDNTLEGTELVLGKIKDLARYIQLNRVDEIYCCLPYIKQSLVPKIIELGELHFIKVKLVADFRGFEDKGFEINRHDQLPVLEVTSFPLDEARNRAIKRVFDVAFSVVAILTVSWLLPLIALAIKIESRGPVIFIQRRSGQGNNNFWCLKFRTMHLNGNADKLQATRKDERVTRVGAFLRRTSLDEIPQFFNVLIGNMSVVGPRPYMLYHTKIYSERLEKFMARHFVKPGITGLAQCKGYRGEIKDSFSLNNRLKLDRFYIENWSILLDVKIVASTVVLLLQGDEKAY